MTRKPAIRRLLTAALVIPVYALFPFAYAFERLLIWADELNNPSQYTVKRSRSAR